MKIIKGTGLEKGFFTYDEPEEISTVKQILHDVRQNGDDAVKRYTLKYDGITLRQIKVGLSEIRNAYHKVDNKTISSIKRAAENIKKFAEKQLTQFKDFELRIAPGVFAGQKVIPVERVGIYVPAGRFPLVSTLLMCAIPAKVAGVSKISVCSPPSYKGSIYPAILVASDIVGVREIYKLGGVAAIGAMAYGTQTVKKVDKIIGPGSKYVALAKKEVFGTVGIDLIAGPTEIMIIADNAANPEYLAADLLAQAEHDIDALPILITTSIEIAKRVKKAVELQLQRLETKNIAKFSISKNGRIILVNNMAEAVNIANKKAPEHLELQIKNPDRYVDKLKNYGSLFIGSYSAVVLGDYSSGLNHTLPTNTTARYTGGFSVKDLIKLQTTLRVTKKGLSVVGPIAKTLSETEGLNGHLKSITVRSKF